MTKTDFVKEVAQRAGLKPKEANAFYDAFISVVGEALAKGEEVILTGFGKFYAKERSARDGRNPKTGEAIKIESYKAPLFRAGAVLKEQIKVG